MLFHLLYLPFNGLGWITASKVVGTVGGAAVLLALFGKTPEEAFYVKCDAETNPRYLIDAGQVNRPVS